MNLLEHPMRVKYPTNEKFAVIGRIDTANAKTSTIVFMKPSNPEEIEKLIAGENITVNHDDRDVIIDYGDCYATGEVDIDGEDADFIRSFNWTSSRFSGNAIPRNYDYETNTGDLYLSLVDNQLKPATIETFDNIKTFKFAHAKIGKPKYVIIYRQMCRKHTFYQ